MAVLAAIALGAASGCASTEERAVPAPRPAVVRLAADYTGIPPAPQDAGPAVREAWATLRSGDVTAAEQALSMAGAEAGGAAERTLAGLIALVRGASAEAMTRFQEALAAAPSYPLALYGLGFLAESQGNRSEGIERYGEAIAADPGLAAAAVRLQILELEQAQALIAEGELAEAGGDDAAALSSYEAARSLGPGVLEPYLRIAAIHRRAGRAGAAVQSLREARDRLGDLRQILRPLGEALREAGEYADSYYVFQALDEVDPNDPEVRALLVAARDLYNTTSLPPEYRSIGEKPEIVREDLAALIAISMPDLGDRVSEPHAGVIITDVDGSWAEPYIRDVVVWGVMEVFQNHGFAPELVVKRQMFAEIAYRVLELLGAAAGAPRARPNDVPPEHYLYEEIQVVVGLGILDLGPRGSFGILDPVSGKEAVDAVQRLVRLARNR